MKSSNGVIREAMNIASRMHFLSFFFSLLSSISLTTAIYFLSQSLVIIFFNKYSFNEEFYLFTYCLISFFSFLLTSFISSLFGESASHKSTWYLKNKYLQSIFHSQTQHVHTAKNMHLLEEIQLKIKPFFKTYFIHKKMTTYVPIYLLLIIFFLNKASFLILLFCLIFMPIIFYILGSYTKQHSKKQLKSLRILSNQFIDSIRGLEVLKLYNQSTAFEKKLETSNESYRKKTMSILKVAFTNTFALEFFSTVSTALIAVQTGFEMILGYSEFTDVLFVLMITPSFFLVFKQFAMSFHISKEAIIVIEDLFPPTITKDEKKRGSHPTKPNFPTVLSSMELQSFSISYEKNSLALFKAININLTPSSIVQLKGISGSGKSSFLYALSGFIPFYGNLLVNKVPTSSLRGMASFLPQNPYFFKTSIRQNISLYGNHSQEQIQKLITNFDLKKSIDLKSKNLDHEINYNYTGLSGGELKRVALIRTLLEPMPIILLDEPTESLDEKNILILMNILLQLKKEGKLIIFSTHTTGLDKYCDHTLEFYQGNIHAS